MDAFASIRFVSQQRPIRIFMSDSGSVSVGHGPGAPSNEGTAPDRGTAAPDSNLTGIDATGEKAPAIDGTRGDAKADPERRAPEGQAR